MWRSENNFVALILLVPGIESMSLYCVAVYLLTESFCWSGLGFGFAFFITIDVEYFECTCQPIVCLLRSVHSDL